MPRSTGVCRAFGSASSGKEHPEAAPVLNHDRSRASPARDKSVAVERYNRALSRSNTDRQGFVLGGDLRMTSVFPEGNNRPAPVLDRVCCAVPRQGWQTRQRSPCNITTVSECTARRMGLRSGSTEDAGNRDVHTSFRSTAPGELWYDEASGSGIFFGVRVPR
jgi:hypothetical protein